MQERLHEHINQELRTNTTTDTIFVLAAIVFDFVMLCIGASAAAGAQGGGPTGNLGMASIFIYLITLLLTAIVNGIAVVGLITGRGTRKLLADGLLKMYHDAQVNEYYDSALLTNYQRRYSLFIGIVSAVAFAAIAIPLVILLFMRF